MKINLSIWIASSLLLLAMTTAYAQAPSLNLPPPPMQPLIILFKNITRQDQFRLVADAVKASKRVDDFMMKRAQRGLIEYDGRFFGEASQLMNELQQATAGKLKLESKTKPDGGLEIIITP